jgi:hypothetical protein
MACPANSRETKIGVGFVEQTDLTTPNTAAEIWSFTITNPAPFTITPGTEDDAADIGKGDEFPLTVFPVAMDVTGRIEKQMSSQAAAWAFIFGLGKTTETAAGTGSKYVCVPTDPAVDCIDLPPFTAVEQIRPAGAPPFTDRAMVGSVITGFTINLESGPGRMNARLNVDIASTGKIVTPSAIVLPAVTTENYLSASSATINIGGIDYIAQKSFVSAEISWTVNARLDTGYYPGSGVDANGYALRGRMEYGQRMAGLTFVARAAPGSPEFSALMTRTEGPATITLTGATIGAGPEKHGIRVHFPRAMFSAVTNGDADGLVIINATVRPLKHAAQGYCSFEATTTKTDFALQPVTGLLEAPKAA